MSNELVQVLADGPAEEHELTTRPQIGALSSALAIWISGEDVLAYIINLLRGLIARTSSAR